MATDMTHRTHGSTTYQVRDGEESYTVQADTPRHAAAQVADGYDLAGQPVDEHPVHLGVYEQGEDGEWTLTESYDAVSDLGAQQMGASLVVSE